MAQPGLRPPHFAAAAAEDILSGARRLRRAFLEAEAHSVQRGTVIIRQHQANPPAFLIHRGLAYRAMSIADGRRAITDILLPGDIVGAESVVMGRATQEIIAAHGLHYRLLDAAAIRDLMLDRQVSLRVLALADEVHQRAEQHIIALARLAARERISACLLGIYERLRRRDLISRPTFNLWLTQEEIGDHLGLTTVYVSRTLRRLRDEKLVLVDRQVVIILDVEGLRKAAGGLVRETGTHAAENAAIASVRLLERVGTAAAPSG